MGIVTQNKYIQIMGTVEDIAEDIINHKLQFWWHLVQLLAHAIKIKN